MPRTSSAALATVTPISDHRPPPPDGLTEAQQSEWRAIVGRLPPDWFPKETHALLEAFVRHVTAHRLLSRLIDEFEEDWLRDPDGLERYTRLLSAREREVRALSSLAVRMRLTQSTRLLPGKAGTAAKPLMPGGSKPPWVA